MSTPSPFLLTRRDALLTALATTAPAVAAAPSEDSADSIYEGLPLIALNEGRWDGTYRMVKPDSTLVEQYDFRIRVSLSRDNRRAYRQDSHYRYPDGSTSAIVFQAAYADGQMRWDDERIFGRLWQISEDTVYLTFGFHGMANTVCHEMIQTQPNGIDRGRTWLWYVDGKLDRYTLIDERRVDDDSPLEWPAP